MYPTYFFLIKIYVKSIWTLGTWVVKFYQGQIESKVILESHNIVLLRDA